MTMGAGSTLESDTAVLRGKSVVVIEDESVTNLQMRRALTLAGMNTIGVVSNGRDGADLVLRERPDVVVLDISMPGEIDGLDAAARILATYRVCILVVSSYNSDEYRWRAQDIGVAGYVNKPVPGKILVAELARTYRNWIEAQKPSS